MKLAPTAETNEKKRTPNITLTYRDCGSKPLGDAMQKLARYTGWKDSKDLMRFAKLKHTWDCHQKRAGQWYQKLLEKHCVMVELKKDGKPVIGPDGRPRRRPNMVPNETNGHMDFDFRDRAAFEKDYKIMGAHEFTIKVYKWDSEELAKAGLDADELLACVKLLEDADDDLLTDLEDLTEETFECPVDMDLTPPASAPQPEAPATGDAPLQP